MEPKTELWHFEKGIPLSIVALVMIQTVGAIWWTVNLSTKVEETAARVASIEAARVSERLTVLESQISDSRASQARIESNLQRLIERSAK